MKKNPKLEANALDRMLLAFAPKFALGRIRARAMAYRHFQAAEIGRRTSPWRRSSGDANAEHGPGLHRLRENARDLIRNNAWARNGQRVIGRNTVGWGILPMPVTKTAELATSANELFKEWGGTTQCDANGEATIFGLQRQIMDTVAEAGEVLVRRRPRRRADGLAIPLQLQVLEPDFLDTSKDGIDGPAGGPIVQGVEFNQIGKRVAYWLYPEHPGSSRSLSIVSNRVLAENVLHIRKLERPGQVRGPSWYSPVIVTFRDFDDYEDGTLMRQKIAACFSAFVTDVQGDGARIGGEDSDDEDPEDLIEELQPGTVSYLRIGEDVKFAAPPPVNDHESYTSTTLRKAAAGLGVTYEDLSQDYSRVNFSSARMGRLAHYANVHDWRYNMMIPQFCDPIWAWAMNAAFIDGTIPEPVSALWTPPPMAMLEPDKEGLAYQRLLRIGAMTHDEMIREQGRDPESHWVEYAEGLKRFDLLKIVLDSDARKTSSAGLTQARAGASGGGGGGGAPPADDSSGDTVASATD